MELKFVRRDDKQDAPPCCGAGSPAHAGTSDPPYEKPPPWTTGTLRTNAGPVFRISTEPTVADTWEHVRCRTSAFRNSYTVRPGLYAAGTPDNNSHVFVSANYKLSFDTLRSSLKGLDAWVLVLDTKGINVWCAAGKGTFGTDELIRRISSAGLDKVVGHRRVIVPQLGAPGISAHKVKKASGFSVCYGPVRARDISAFIDAGCRATRQMRTVTFPFMDRLILTPMEINPAMMKYYPWYALVVCAVFGLQPEGIIFRDAISGGLPFLLLGLTAVLSGALVTPALLPCIPFRSFAVKGWITGIISVLLLTKLTTLFTRFSTPLLLSLYLFFPLASSYIALQFTGATTFTGMSGVKKELKITVPIYIGGTIISLILLLANKLQQWGII